MNFVPTILEIPRFILYFRVLTRVSRFIFYSPLLFHVPYYTMNYVATEKLKIWYQRKQDTETTTVIPQDVE